MHSKVAVVQCRDYDPSSVHSAIEKALSLLDGVDSFISAGNTVLLKPNAFGPWDPDRAATTHPVVVETVVRIAQEAGANVQIGESAAGTSYGKTKQTLERSGIAEVARTTSAELLDFDELERHKRYIGAIDREMIFSDCIAAADVIISLPKLKTHGLTGISGAIKNMYGTMPGPAKSQLHKEFPDRHLFGKAIVAICLAVRPALSIMDAIISMEGNGPANGRPKSTGIILASADPVAMDTLAVTRIMNMPSEQVAMLQAGADLGLGTNNISEIEILGDGFPKTSPEQKFLLPITYSMYGTPWIPRFFKSRLINKANRSAKPKIKESCTGCGECVEACPTNAIEMTPEGRTQRRAYINLATCISCFCCYEICQYSNVDIKVPLTWRIGGM